jgi:ABC-type sugar transport system permease subunit
MMRPQLDEELGQARDQKERPGDGGLFRGRWRGGRRSVAVPYLFLLPFFAIYTVFLLYPTFAALRLSFYEAVALDTPSFTGLDNYVRLVQDERYLHALRNTTVYALASVFILSPLALVVALAIRSFLVPSANLKSFYRISLFLPFITSFVVIALMFSLVFNKDFGLLNSFFDSIGLPRLNWLRSERLAMVSIILVAIWTYLGVNSLYFLAGLQNIPEELNEAAAIDGAGRWKTFRYVTLPLLQPTILFVVIQATIFSYQLFEIPFLLTDGGPSDATLFLALYLYEVGFSQFDRGYAAAIGYSMALISIVLAVIQLYLFRRFNR